MKRAEEVLVGKCNYWVENMPFTIIKNDITKVHADAIVNSANPRPTFGRGTDSAIYQAAGVEDLLKEREKIGMIAVGEAVATDAFSLNAKYIIHTVGPVWQGGTDHEFEKLASCYRKSLQLAKMLKCESIAFPLISAGTYRFPKDKALTIALREIRAFLENEEMDVSLVVFDKTVYQLSEELAENVKQYIDRRSVEANAEEVDASAVNAAKVDAAKADHEEYRVSAEVRKDKFAKRRSDRWHDQNEPGNLFSSFSEKIKQRRKRKEREEKEQSAFSAPSFLREEEADFSWDESISEEAPYFNDAMPSPSSGTSLPPASGALPLPSSGASPLPSSGSSLPSSSGAFPPSLDDTASFSSSGAFPSFQSPEGMSQKSAIRKKTAKKTARKIEAIKPVKPQKSLDDIMRHIGENFQEMLFRLIDERGLTDKEVYKKANIDRKLFSKIRCNPNYLPKKETALAFAIALNLTLDETVDLLARAGIALSPGNKFDLIVEYCIENQIYDIFSINSILFDYDQPTLGS